MPVISTVSWSASPMGTPVLSAWDGFSGGGIGSTRFDGPNEYLQLPSSASPNDHSVFGNGDFTIEAFVYFDDTAENTSRGGLWQLSTNALGPQANSTNNLAVGVYSTSGVGHWYMYAGNTGPTYSSHDSGVDFTEGQWHHVAQVRSSGTTKLYVDGTQVLSVSDSCNYTNTYGIIGGYYSQSYLLEDAVLSNFRIIKKAIYTSNFTPPTTKLNPGTAGTKAKVLTCFNTTGTITDAASTFNITVNGNPAPSSETPFS